VGGTATLSSFAGALLAYCQKEDSLVALADALRATGEDLSPAVLQITGVASAEESLLSTGAEIGPYRIARQLGDGRFGATYLARGDQGEVRIKILHPESARDHQAVQRYLVANRLAAKAGISGLPELIHAGEMNGRLGVVHTYIEGQPLSVRVSRTGPMHINEARPLLQAIAQVVVDLHEKHLFHGALSLDNIIAYRGPDGQPGIALLDLGTDKLRARQIRERTGLSSTGTNPRTVSPEQVRGADATRASDIYALGAVMYELLSGRPVFEGDVLEIAFGHLSKRPAAPSTVAPRGWITPDIDEFILRLLSKNPTERGSAKSVLDALEDLGRAKREHALSQEQIEDLEQTLLADPADVETAMTLESAVGRGATADQIGQAFRLAATMIDDPIAVDTKKGLLLRAARLLEQDESSMEKAEAVYEELLSIDPRDRVAQAGIEEVRRRAGKFEELIEMLLARAEASHTPQQRARAMADIGRIYYRDLHDAEQAISAYSLAFCDDPQDEYASEIERVAGTSEPLWASALSNVGEASADQTLPQDKRTQLLLRAGNWYLHRISRADLALPCLQGVLSVEPSNESALEGVSSIYRKAQQWHELGALLTHRADAAPTPERARDLRTEAAEILEQRIGDIAGARAVYELVLSEDPAHVKAGEALSRILEKSGDFDVLVKLLKQRLEAQPAEDAIRSLCRIGEIYDDRLGDTAEAVKMYNQALERDPSSLDALRGLERAYAKTNRYKELLENLELQVRLSATPKQKISLLERIAAVQEEEFLNHPAAASALERALEADPGRVQVMHNLVRFYRVMNRWEDASKLYQRQLELVEEPAERIALAVSWGRVLADQIGSPERAVHAYELVLEEDSEHAGALEALAKLREATGDADQALEAILSLAEQAETPAARAEQYVRAAVLQQSRGNRDAAIEHYRNAMDAQPDDRNISAALRKAYVERGDINAAVELLQREIDVTEGERAQAKLAGEMARLQRERLKDDDAAESSAQRALRLDPGSFDALLVLGDICFEKGRFVEASSHYGRIADRVETLGPENAVPVLFRYVDALAKSGSTESALSAMDVLMRLAPDDADAVGRVAQVTFEHGSAKRAAELYYNYLTRFGADITERERAQATYRLGEAYRKCNDLPAAVQALKDAAEMDPAAEEPLAALAQAYLDQGNFAEAVRTKTDQLDLAVGDTRHALLVELGDLYATKLNDRTQAAKSLMAALEEKPDDRRLLTKLMQLYSEDKDWNRLVEIVVKLAEGVDDPIQKIKYLQTAALVSGRQLGDANQAAYYFDQVLDIDPGNEKAVAELASIQKEAGNYTAVEDLLKRKLAAAEKAEDNTARLATLEELAELYERHLVAPDLAAQAYEAANDIDPGNRERLDKLAKIYASDLDTYRDKGIQLQEYLLSQSPFRQESYKALRKIYTVARDADASWALCQVLTVLQLAEPDEARFYERMRAETAAPAQDAFNEEDWVQRVMHPQLDPLLTAIFGLIQGAVVRSRAQPLAQMGITPEMQIDPSQHQAPLAQTLYYAAGVLGLPLPAVFANPYDQGGLTYLFTETPCISMGKVGMSSQVPPQVAAFVAAQQLSYLRPGLYMRHFVQTGTALKAWLFAAIKLTSPQFPVAPDLEGSVTENLAALRQYLPADAKDHLASVVSKLIQSGVALDLKKWVAAADLTADRAGFIVSHDLRTTAEVIGATDESTAAVSNEDRYREIVLYAASQKYFQMRHRLGITVDS
jgi:tetratricopeptide (TPR) repeat protein